MQVPDGIPPLPSHGPLPHLPTCLPVRLCPPVHLPACSCLLLPAVKVLEAPPGGYLEDRLERQWTGGAATSSSTPTSTSAAVDDGSSSIKSAGGKVQLQAAFHGSSGFDELAPNGGSSALGTPRQYRRVRRMQMQPPAVQALLPLSCCARASGQHVRWRQELLDAALVSYAKRTS